MTLSFTSIELLALDVDGTLTNARTWWQGADVGWVQSYSVRDGEAILRMTARGLPIVPVSANLTASAKQRMELLGLPTRWMGVTDKVAAINEVAQSFNVQHQHICYVGDGLGDCEVFKHVGLGCAVRDAHPEALRSAHYVTQARGGHHVIEEVEQLIFHASR